MKDVSLQDSRYKVCPFHLHSQLRWLKQGVILCLCWHQKKTPPLSSVIETLHTIYSDSQLNCFMTWTFFLLLLTSLSCPQILISMGDFKMVEHPPKATSKKDCTNVLTNFNLALLDDEFSPMIAATTRKLSGVGAEHLKHHGTFSSTNHPLRSLKSHKWKRYFAAISKHCYVWIIKNNSLCTILDFYNNSGSLDRCISQRLRGALCTDHYNQVTIFSFLLHKNHYFVAQYFIGTPTNHQEKK